MTVLSADADQRRFGLSSPRRSACSDPRASPRSARCSTSCPRSTACSRPTSSRRSARGGGIPYADYALHDAQGDFNRPAYREPARLRLAGAASPACRTVSRPPVPGPPRSVAAKDGPPSRWPEPSRSIHVDGYDNDDASIAAARKHAAEAGVSDRARFEVVDVTRDLPERIAPASYDLVIAFEMIHDLARPVEALTTMRRLGKPDAVHLVMDEKVAETFEAPTENPIERLMYAASVLHCLPVGRAETPSAATGTVMRPATFRTYAARRRLHRRRHPPDRARPVPLLPPRRLTQASGSPRHRGTGQGSSKNARTASLNAGAASMLQTCPAPGSTTRVDPMMAWWRWSATVRGARMSWSP